LLRPVEPHDGNGVCYLVTDLAHDHLELRQIR
jgi:hypothetical protein